MNIIVMMSDADVVDIAVRSLILAGKLGAPILLTALGVGFLISVFQAATQIQEPTLSFVPKAVAIAIAVLLSGNWMLHEMVTFSHDLFAMLPRLLGKA